MANEKAKAGAVVIVGAGLGAERLAELMAGAPLTVDDVMAIMAEVSADFVTSAQMEDRLTAALATATEAAAALKSALPSGVEEKGPIDAKYLDGLTFKTSKPRKGGPNDDDATVHVPVERKMTPDDVLDWRDMGDTLSIVTADGQSLKVPKK